MMTQSLWDTAEEILGERFVVMQSYLKKQEKYRIDSLTLYLERLEKEKQNKTNNNNNNKKKQSQQKEGDHKDQSRNKLKGNEGNNSRD